ncbi:MAG TPA: ATP-binding cassette domain-containing protein [Acidimicrobiales bacterium]|nr:ATP-binding cassette domain-containing protein [Acidimicrobiales bacterium]
MSGIVDVDRVSKSYGAVQALADVSLTVDAGELVALIGPSGSGKTTLLNVVAGWERADAGVVRWGAPHRGWAHLAVVPQAASLLPDLSLLENVTLPLRVSAATADTDAPRRVLDALGLDDLADRLPEELSHGEQQRGALARALVLQPDLLVADEPTAHLDGETTRRVLRVLRDAARAGTACLVATHDPEVLDAVDRAVPLRDGRLT